MCARREFLREPLSVRASEFHELNRAAPQSPEMRSERLPEEFIATILSGWWMTCLEVLPAKERRRGRY